MKPALKTLLALALLALASALPAEVQHTLQNLERDLDDINYAVVSHDQIHDLEKRAAKHHHFDDSFDDGLDEVVGRDLEVVGRDLEKMTAHTANFPPLDWDVIRNNPEHPLHEIIAWRKQMEGMTDLERQQHIEEVTELQAKLAAAETDEERMAILKWIKGAASTINTIVVLHSV